jgi:hypothetical protein
MSLHIYHIPVPVALSVPSKIYIKNKDIILFITSGESSGPQTARRAESGDQAKYETPWLCPSSTYNNSVYGEGKNSLFTGMCASGHSFANGAIS